MRRWPYCVFLCLPGLLWVNDKRKLVFPQLRKQRKFPICLWRSVTIHSSVGAAGMSYYKSSVGLIIYYEIAYFSTKNVVDYCSPRFVYYPDNTTHAWLRQGTCVCSCCAHILFTSLPLFCHGNIFQNFRQTHTPFAHWAKNTPPQVVSVFVVSQGMISCVCFVVGSQFKRRCLKISDVRVKALSSHTHTGEVAFVSWFLWI